MTDADAATPEAAAATDEAKPNGVAEAEPTSQPMETEAAPSKPSVRPAPFVRQFILLLELHESPCLPSSMAERRLLSSQLLCIWGLGRHNICRVLEQKLKTMQ